MEKATQFIEQVVAQVKDLQFFTAKGSKGGPIIMTQVCTSTTFTEFLKEGSAANFDLYLCKWEKLATLDLKDKKLKLH